jgi:C1A family cysteine protease
MRNFAPPGLGWQPDLHDHRDYGTDHSILLPLLAANQDRRALGKSLAPDLRAFFPAVKCQGGLAASPAYACAALVEYFQRRIHGKSVDGSALFLYKMARQLERCRGDVGASLRTTLKALVRFGLPPITQSPEIPANFDEVPPAHLFAYSRDYESVAYFRLDRPVTAPVQTLSLLKSCLVAGLPVAFGFTVCDNVSLDADIPFPSSFETVVGGQAVVAVGYDDKRRIRSEKGAIRIRNSWGTGWGEDGYGWLPYRYVSGQLANDFWTVLRPDWADAEELTAPE